MERQPFRHENDLENLKEHLAELIRKACANLKNSRIHIPVDNGQVRISEQELRFPFIEYFLKDHLLSEYSYSIETPTILKYIFSRNGKKITPTPEADIGRKGNIDVTIFKGDKRIAIIEFKMDGSHHSHAKDFIKLKSEPGDCLIRLFVEIYTATQENNISKITDKLFRNKFHINLPDNVDYIGFSLKHVKKRKDVGCRFIEVDREKKTIRIFP